MKYSIRTKYGESIIYIILWLIILLMPIFISKTNNQIDWSKVQREWVRLLPFALIFLVHNYLLFPFFFLRNRRILYYISILTVVVLGGLFSDFIGNLIHQIQQTQDLPPMNMDPIDINRERPPMGPPVMGPRMGMNEDPMLKESWQKIFIDNGLVSILVVGFNAAIKLIVKWQHEEQRIKELEKEKLQTELAFLKNQVSPHFFMNTLNNIHALIDIKAEDAKESIIKLSKLMRYLLYDSEEGKTTLAKEIEFIKSYVDLMKLRYTSKVSIKLSFPEKVPNIEIPPMLFTSLIENAFKHGVSYQKESFIDLIMKTGDDLLYFRIKNSKRNSNNGLNEPGGIGMENLKKRLDLIYSNRYTLDQKEDDDYFEITIKLPING